MSEKPNTKSELSVDEIAKLLPLIKSISALLTEIMNENKHDKLSNVISGIF